MTLAFPERLTAWVVMTLLAVAFCYGVWTAGRLDQGSAGLGKGADGRTAAAALEILRDGLTADGRVKANFSRNVGWFRTAEGRLVRLWVTEMEMRPDAITPWPKQAVGRTLIVDSVDERQNIAGGVSGFIGPGCGQERYQGVALPAGTARIDRCDGPYRESFGIVDVGKIAVVTFAEDDLLRTKACVDLQSAVAPDAYNTCLDNYARSGFSDLFNRMASERRYDNIVIPEIGTGIGGLSKKQFYGTFFDKLNTALKSPDQSAALPDNIFLQVYSNDDPESFREAVTAIGPLLTQSIGQAGGSSPPKGWLDWLRLSGVAGGIALTMLALLVSPRASGRLGQFRSLVNGRNLLVFPAWLIVSYGIAGSVASLLPPMGKIEPWLQLAIGVLVVPSAGVLSQAIQGVKDAMTEPVLPSGPKKGSN